MISTKYLLKISDVPETWIFENYACLNERLTGEDLTIKSLFKPAEKTPSMKIFSENGRYFYKDFSSGNGGTAIGLVEKMYGITYGEAVSKIINDYESYLKLGHSHVVRKIKQKTKTIIDSFEILPWTLRDQKFWSQFNIGSSLLEHYNVRPCNIILRKGDNLIDLSGKMIYGYFDDKGEIYKIYQPYNKENKFLSFKTHIQGLDQLEFNNPYILIVSSLKDGMTLKSLKLPVDFVAPASENTIISNDYIKFLKTKYKKIAIMLDNDEAGLLSMLKYNSLYDIPYSNLDLSKDISDSVRDFGAQKTQSELCEIFKILFS